MSYFDHFALQLRKVDPATFVAPIDPEHQKRLNSIRWTRYTDTIEPLSAVHLTNISLLVPDISENIHTIAKRSIMYNPKNKETLNALSYSSPWAAMASLNARDIILQARSIIANVSGRTDSSKTFEMF